MSATDEPSEDELRAAYEAEIKKIRIEQILLEQVVSIINLGMRRTGLAPGTEDERDVEQVRVAIEQSAPAQAGQIRDALSQLQMAFVRLGGAPAPGAADPGEAGPERPAGPRQGPPAGSQVPGQPDPGEPKPGEGEPKPGDGGPAQRSGRLWVPGQ